MKLFTLRFTLAVCLTLTFFIITPSPRALAQGEVAFYSEDFEGGPAGWVPIDLKAIGIMWHHTTYEGLGVAWCGIDDPEFYSPPGYGNYWIQTLSKSFTLPVGTPALWFSIQFDTELNYDFWYAEISNDGGTTFTVLHQAHGQSPSGGFHDYFSDLSAYAGQNVVIRFRFSSDTNTSDEDWLDTNGACRLDWVEVAGHRDEFNTDLDGWTPDSTEPGGGPYRLEAGLGGNSTQAWTAYDLDGPYAGQFPYAPPVCQSQNNLIRIGIESPQIIMPPYQDSYILEFDVYRDLPLCEWVFYKFEVATRYSTGAWEWKSDIFIYYAPDDPPVWRTFRIDLLNAVIGKDESGDYIYGSIINSGTLMMKVRLFAIEYNYGPFCGQHPAGPFFDNVRLLIPSDAGTLAGNVLADCPSADTPLHGVKLVAYDGFGAEAGTDVTDETGAFDMTLMSGAYTLSIVTPLGYGSIPAEYAVNVPAGETTVQDFSLSCLEIESHPRSIGYWKHQVSEALGNKGNGHTHRIRVNGKGQAPEETPDVESPVCDYLDLVSDHFNSNAINQVIVYVPPSSGLCTDKLVAAGDLLNLLGSQEMVARARQQLMALLLNAAAGNIHLTEVISEDGATVSQAITFCDNLIDDPMGDHEAAKTIADLVNNGILVPVGMIPLDTDQIAYRQGIPSSMVQLGNRPNPFNPNTRIHFTLADAGDYRLSIFDSAGQLVQSFNGEGKRGLNEVFWDGTSIDCRKVCSGVYFSVLEANGLRETNKMTLLK